MMMSYYFWLLIFVVLVLFFYIKWIIESIQFKKKYNIKTSISSVEIICHVIACTFCFIDITGCVWALFNNY